MQQQASGRFLLRDWDDGCVVFDRRFGNTHALNSITAEVFKALLAAPDEAPHQVVARLSDGSQGQAPHRRETLDQALEQLAAYQLTARD